MTPQQLEQGKYLTEQEACIDRLFTMLQEEADYAYCLDNCYRAVVAEAFTRIKHTVREEFAGL